VQPRDCHKYCIHKLVSLQSVFLHAQPCFQLFLHAKPCFQISINKLNIQCFHFDGNFLFEGNFNKLMEIIRKIDSEENFGRLKEM
jgi:hypothetical protein